MILEKLFASKGRRRILFLCTGLALLTCIFSLTTPIMRKKSAMERTGSQISMQFSAMALAVSSLEGDSIAHAMTSPEGEYSAPVKHLLNSLSSQYQLHRSYILGKSVDGKLFYLADSGIPAQDALPAAAGDFYEDALYPKKCLSFAKKTLESAPAWQGNWYPQPLGDGLVVCYFPITNREGTSVALLGVEAPLNDPNFAQYQFINFHQLAVWSGILFVVLFLLCLLVLKSLKLSFLKEQLAEQAPKKKASKPVLTLEAKDIPTPSEANEEEDTLS